MEVFEYYLALMSSVYQSCIGVFQSGLSSVCFSISARLMETFLSSTNKFWRKVRAYWSCIVVFLAEICLNCVNGESHSAVSFENTEHTFW